MSLTIFLLGYISFTRLPVREYPETDPPIVSVTTFYRGASPAVVETEITDVLEEQFTTIESVKTITSSSREQGSVITIEFELQRDVDEAANDVRAALAAIIVFLRQSWLLARQDKKVTLYSRSTMLSADYTALLRTLTLIAAAHILLVLISIAFSPFPTPWLLSFTVFSIAVLLTIYFVPQLPIKRRLQAEKRELLARIGSAKKQILYSELTPQALEHLAKLSALEDKVSKVSTSLSQRDDAWVKWSTLAIGLLPYAGTLLAALGASAENNPFVKTLSEFLPVLKLVFGFPG